MTTRAELGRTMRERRQRQGLDRPNRPRPFAHPSRVSTGPALILLIAYIWIVSAQILQLLGHAGLQRLFANHGASGVQAILTDDDDGTSGVGRRRRRRRTSGPKFPKVPSEQGKKLMSSGTFGSNEYYRDPLMKRKPRLAMRLMQRELGIDDARSKRTNRLMSQVRYTPLDLGRVLELKVGVCRDSSPLPPRTL